MTPLISPNINSTSIARVANRSGSIQLKAAKSTRVLSLNNDGTGANTIRTTSGHLQVLGSGIDTEGGNITLRADGEASGDIFINAEVSTRYVRHSNIFVCSQNNVT
jgi:hypothetical protein